jgi:hypothetical protein
MLIKCFDGARLSTLQNQVLAFTISPSLIIATAKALPLAPSSLITRTTQIKPRGLQTNANIFVAA